MKKRIDFLRLGLVFSTLFIVAFASSCKKEEEVKVFDMVAAQQSIDEINLSYAEAFTKTDAAGVASFYTEDAKFMSPNAPALEGKAAIQEEMNAFFKNGAMKLEIKSIGLWGDEDLLTQESTWAVFDKDGNEKDHGKSLMIYKKEGDKWKIFRDCYNSDINGETTTPETAAVAEENK